MNKWKTGNMRDAVWYFRMDTQDLQEKQKAGRAFLLIRQVKRMCGVNCHLVPISRSVKSLWETSESERNDKNEYLNKT